MYFTNEKAKAKQNALDYFPGQLNPLCPLAWTKNFLERAPYRKYSVKKMSLTFKVRETNHYWDLQHKLEPYVFPLCLEESFVQF